jgi:enoyl-[acyl-carrier protein] reductase I
MIEHGARYVVMGLLNADSIAYAIGTRIGKLGGEVVYTVQNPVLKKRFLDESSDLSDAERGAIRFEFCDVTNEAEVRALFSRLAPIRGVVHSIAYANPRTCLGEELHTEAVADVLQSYHISCVSLATVAGHAREAMPDGGAIVALSFETERAFASYNWMGVNKAALEALVRALARRHGRDRIRVNAVSAGPLWTKAASKIPGFGGFSEIWSASSPIPWDPAADKVAVADAAAFLLGPCSAKITGQVLKVDGGASAVGGRLLPHERPEGAGEDRQ